MDGSLIERLRGEARAANTQNGYAYVVRVFANGKDYERFGNAPVSIFELFEGPAREALHGLDLDNNEHTLSPWLAVFHPEGVFIMEVPRIHQPSRDAELVLEHISDAREIFNPETLLNWGFSVEVVEANTDIMESNPANPKEWIRDAEGKMVNQLRGVVAYDLAVSVARTLGVTYADGFSGLQRQLRAIRNALAVHLGRQPLHED